jgi:hypothetical protein
MATLTVISKQLTDNYAVLQTLTNNEIVVGGSITVASVGTPFNGTFVVRALPAYKFIGVDDQGDLQFDVDVPIETYLNQVLYPCTGSDVLRGAASGTITYGVTCTWATTQNVLDWLGISVASAEDQAFVASCKNAANQVAYRRRQESGYIDSATVHPSDDVLLGTIMLAGAYYRARGSMDQFASFSDMGTAPTVGITPTIMQLLGISRPQVA